MAFHGEGVSTGRPSLGEYPQFVEIVIDYNRMRWRGALGRRAYADLQAKLDVKPKPPIAVPTLFLQGAADACDLPEGAQGQEICFTQGYELVLVQRRGALPSSRKPGFGRASYPETTASNR